MHVGEPCRQHSVTAEGENHARRTEDVARDEAEGRDACAREQNGAADVAKKLRGGFRERGVFMVCQIDTERPLRHELDRDIDDGGDNDREISRAWHRTRGIFYLSAR